MLKLQRPDECVLLKHHLTVEELGMSHNIYHTDVAGKVDIWTLDTSSLGIFNLADAQLDLNYWIDALHKEAEIKASQGKFYKYFAECRRLGCNLEWRQDVTAPRFLLKHNDEIKVIDQLLMETLPHDQFALMLNDFLSTQHAQSTGAKPMDAVVYDMYGQPIKDFEDALPYVLSGWRPEQLAAAKMVLKYHDTLGRKMFMEMAADGGCPQCKTASQFSVDPPMGQYGRTATHDSLLPHLSAVMSCKPFEVLPLLLFVLGDDGTFLEPESRPQTFYGWRGYKPSDHFPIIQGAWAQVWGTAKMEATCPHPERGMTGRETCIDHIKHRGQTALEIKQDLAGRVSFSGVEGKSCQCGIYGYAKYDGLIQQQSDSNYTFTFMAYGAAWGYVAMDDQENFKATDFKIDHMYMLKNRMSTYVGAEPRVTEGFPGAWSYDWQGLAAKYSEHYGVPVYIVEKENDVKMWEDLQTLTNSVGVNDDD